jgi:type IV pilus assembly protein PilW
VRTGRFGRGELYAAPAAPLALAAPPGEIHALATRGYYVSPTSSLSVPGNPVPSLRVKTLSYAATGPRIVDEEIYPGVEDMQIELGIDTDRPGTDGFGAIDAYIDPESSSLAGTRILAVRVWLLVRSLQRENGFTANPQRRYADRVLAGGDDHYRRTLVMTTMRARNAVHTR